MEIPFKIYEFGGNGASTARLYNLSNVPSFSSRYFNKIKRTSRLGRLLALSMLIARNSFYNYTARFVMVEQF